MKKLMFGMVSALALCGLAIESSNVVGYNTKDVEMGKFAIAAVQFEGTDGTTDINKLIGGMTGGTYDDDFTFRATAPHIQVPNATTGGYDLYYYLEDGYYVDENGQDAYKPGWCDAYGTIAGDTEAGARVSGEIIPAVAIWVKDASASETMSVAGQVPAVNEVTVASPKTFALRANAFPVAFNLNDSAAVTYAGLTPAAYDDDFSFRETAPHIQVPNATTGGYDLYYYLEDGYYVDENGQDAYKPGWCDAYGTIAGDTEAGARVSGLVPQGFGFWAKGVGSEFSITFKK